MSLLLEFLKHLIQIDADRLDVILDCRRLCPFAVGLRDIQQISRPTMVYGTLSHQRINQHRSIHVDRVVTG